jgi:pimeloyl-ACP methyl ester carboxylesterase
MTLTGDYCVTADISNIVLNATITTLLVGHSMGGMIVQK